MTRTTTTSAPDAHGMITTESRQPHGDIWIRLKFRWLAIDVGGDGYKDALAAHHASMDYLLRGPISAVPAWAVEKPEPAETPPASVIAATATASEPVPPTESANILRDTYRARGVQIPG